MSEECNDLLGTALNFVKLMNYDKAEELFLNIIKKYPDNIDAFYHYGKMKAENQNDIDGAIRLFKKCIDIVPFFEALKYLAECYLIKRDLYNSEKYLKQALIYNSSSQECFSYIDRVFPKLKNYVKEEKTSANDFYETSKNINSVIYKKINDAGHITRKAPYCLLELFTEKQKARYQKCLEQCLETDYPEDFVVEVQNGKVYLSPNRQFYIFPSDNKYLKDPLDLIGTPVGDISEQEYLVNFSGNILVLTSCFGENYYHWLTYTVPKLYMLEQAGYSLKKFDAIAVNHSGIKYQRELLELLNIPKNKIIAIIPRGVVIKAPKIVAASTPYHKITPPIVLESLRKKLLKPEYYDTNFPKRIYLSRNKSETRHILNEDVLTDFLKKEGFEIIYAEELSVVDQIKYFANADVIISQHGAGLTNLAFSKEGTKVLEIYNDNMKDYMDSGFMRLANDNNLTHLVMYGEDDSLSLDMNIDMDKFKTNYDYLMNL